MASEMERLIEELSAIRGHLASIEAAANGYMRDRFWGKGSLLEQYQKECDDQARPWELYYLPSSLEAIELQREAREAVRREAKRKPPTNKTRSDSTGSTGTPRREK